MPFNSRYYNEDLRPTPISDRKWNTFNMSMLWVSMTISVPTLTLVSISLSYGLSPWQTVINVFLGNLLVLIPILLNSHGGTKFGLSFPLFVRAAFGIRGAHFPGVIRAITGCSWLAVQGWVGGGAIAALIEVCIPSFDSDNFIINLPSWGGMLQVNGLHFIGFILFMILAGIIAYRGRNSIRRMVSIVGPILVVMVLLLIAWAYGQLRDELDFMEIMALGYDAEMVEASGGLLKCFFATLMTSISYWSTMAISIPDFSRYAKSQSSQVWGQIIGLLGGMILCAFAGVYFAQATRLKYGTIISDPTSVLFSLDNTTIIVISSIAITLATVTTCVTLNIIASANVIANLKPRKLNYKKGVLISIAFTFVFIQAWWIYDSETSYFTIMNAFGIILAPIVAILVADYWIVHRCEIEISQLYYKEGSRYWYRSGWNHPAFIAWILAFIVPLIGLDVNITGAFIDFVNSISYFWSFFIGFFGYLVLYRLITYPSVRSSS